MALLGTVYNTLHATVYNTLHGTVYNTLHGTVHNTLHSNVYNTLDGTVYNTLYGNVYNTLHVTLNNTLHCMTWHCITHSILWCSLESRMHLPKKLCKRIKEKGWGKYLFTKVTTEKNALACFHLYLDGVDLLMAITPRKHSYLNYFKSSWATVYLTTSW